MDELEAVTTMLAERELETLKFFVAKAEKCGSQHLAWDRKKTHILRMADCNVQFEHKEFESRHPSLEALATLGFTSFRSTGDAIVGSKYHLTLYPAAFHRVKYERLGRLGKWWKRTGLQYKDTLGVAAFIISVVLTIKELIEFIAAR